MPAEITVGIVIDIVLATVLEVVAVSAYSSPVPLLVPAVVLNVPSLFQSIQTFG